MQGGKGPFSVLQIQGKRRRSGEHPALGSAAIPESRNRDGSSSSAGGPFLWKRIWSSAENRGRSELARTSSGPAAAKVRPACRSSGAKNGLGATAATGRGLMVLRTGIPRFTLRRMVIMTPGKSRRLSCRRRPNENHAQDLHRRRARCPQRGSALGDMAPWSARTLREAGWLATTDGPLVAPGGGEWTIVQSPGPGQVVSAAQRGAAS